MICNVADEGQYNLLVEQIKLILGQSDLVGEIQEIHVPFFWIIDIMDIFEAGFNFCSAKSVFVVSQQCSLPWSGSRSQARSLQLSALVQVEQLQHPLHLKLTILLRQT